MKARFLQRAHRRAERQRRTRLKRLRGWHLQWWRVRDMQHEGGVTVVRVARASRVLRSAGATGQLREDVGALLGIPPRERQRLRVDLVENVDTAADEALRTRLRELKAARDSGERRREPVAGEAV